MSEVRIETVGAEVEGAKRQHVGAIVHFTCPECGQAGSVDLSSEDYLAHPLFGETYDLDLYCWEGREGACQHEWSVEVIPRLTLELAP